MHCPHMRQSKTASLLERSISSSALRNPFGWGATCGGLRSSTSLRIVRGSLQRGRGHLLARIHERQGGRRCDERAGLGLDVDLRAGLGQFDRHPRVADVLLEPRRPDGIGNASDLLAVLEDGPELRQLGAELANALELDSDELARDALAADLLERRLPDVVLRLLLHEALEPAHLERV